MNQISQNHVRCILPGPGWRNKLREKSLVTTPFTSSYSSSVSQSDSCFDPWHHTHIILLWRTSFFTQASTHFETESWAIWIVTWVGPRLRLITRRETSSHDHNTSYVPGSWKLVSLWSNWQEHNDPSYVPWSWKLVSLYYQNTIWVKNNVAC